MSLNLCKDEVNHSLMQQPLDGDLAAQLVVTGHAGLGITHIQSAGCVLTFDFAFVNS